MNNKFKQHFLIAYLESLQAKVNVVRELQSAAGEELRPFFGRTLLPSRKGMISVLDRAFRGEL